MLEQITYFQILGLPFIVYLGIVTLILFLFTAMIPFLQKKGVKGFNFKLHVTMARISIGLTGVHGFLGIMSYF
jgi:hypothetical protein